MSTSRVAYEPVPEIAKEVWLDFTFDERAETLRLWRESGARRWYKRYNGVKEGGYATYCCPLGLAMTCLGGGGEEFPIEGREVVDWLEKQKRFTGDDMSSRYLARKSAIAFMNWWDTYGRVGGWRALAEAMREEVTE